MDICIHCGKKKPVKEFLCGGCYEKIHPSHIGVRKIDIKLCKDLPQFFFQRRWRKYDSLDLAIQTVVRQVIKMPKAKIIPKIRFHAKKGSVNIEVEVKNGKDYYVLPARLVYDRCPMSENVRTGYFEAILQLRNVSKEIVSFARKKIGSKAQITKEEQVRNGLDWYVSNTNVVISIGKKLQKQFGGIYKLSRTLYTEDKTTGKRVYRVTVLFKSLPFKTNDEFVFRGEKFIVLNMGKDLYVENQKGVKKHISFADLERYNVV